MASINFDANLDTSKLDKSIEDNKKKLAEWLAAAQELGGEFDKIFDKLGEAKEINFKTNKDGAIDEINDLNTAIKNTTPTAEINVEVKNLDAAAQSVSAYVGKVRGEFLKIDQAYWKNNEASKDAIQQQITSLDELAAKAADLEKQIAGEGGIQLDTEKLAAVKAELTQTKEQMVEQAKSLVNEFDKIFADPKLIDIGVNTETAINQINTLNTELEGRIGTAKVDVEVSGMEQAQAVMRSYLESLVADFSQIDEAYWQNNQSAAASINAQKELVEGLIKQVEEYEAALNQANQPGGLEMSAAQVKDTEDALAFTKGRLAKESDRLTVSMEKEVAKFGQAGKAGEKLDLSLKSVGAGLLKMVSWTAAAGVAMKIFQGAIASGGNAADALKANIEGLQGALGQFFTQVRQGDFNSLIENMIKAAKAAKEFAEAQEYYNKSVAAGEILNTEDAAALNKLEAIYRNSNSGFEARNEALQKWKKIKIDSAKQDVENAEQLITAFETKIKSMPGLSWVKPEDLRLMETIYYESGNLMKLYDELMNQTKGMSVANFLDEDSKKWSRYTKEVQEQRAKLTLLASSKGISIKDLIAVDALENELSKKSITGLGDAYEMLGQKKAKIPGVNAEIARTEQMVQNSYVGEIGSIGKLSEHISKLEKIKKESANPELASQYQGIIEAHKVELEILESKYSGARTKAQEIVAQNEIARKELKQGVDIRKAAMEKELATIKDEYDKQRNLIATQVNEPLRKALEEKYQIDTARVKQKYRDEDIKRQAEFDKEMARQREDDELEIQGKLIEIQKEGAVKQRAQALLDYRKSISELNRKREDTIEAQNKQSGGLIETTQGLKPTAEYKDYLVGRAAEVDAKQREAIEKKLQANLVQIRKNTAEQLERIDDEMTAAFRSTYQKNIESIKEKYKKLYDELRAAAAPAWMFLQLVNAQMDELTNADKDNATERQAIMNEATAIFLNNTEQEVQAINSKYDNYKNQLIETDATAEELEENERARRKEIKNATSLLTPAIMSAADAAQYLAGLFAQSNEELAGMLSALGNLGTQINDWIQKGYFDLMDGKKMSKGEAFSNIVGGATELAGIFIRQAEENKKKVKEYYLYVKQQQQEYNFLLYEQIRIQSEEGGSVFINDYIGRITDGVKAYDFAMTNYRKSLELLGDAQAKAGFKGAVSGKNVLEGAGAGAALGAGVGTMIMPGIGTLIGAGVGAIGGAIAGLFAKKKKDIFKPILEVYPDLIKANGDFNASLAQTLIDQNLLKEGSEAILQNIIDWQKAADEAQKQIEGVISDLAGSIGSDLSNALVDAFTNGTDSAVAFGKVVDNILSNIMAQLVFNAVFGAGLAKLEQAMKDSYDPKSKDFDQSWMDDFTEWAKGAKESIPLYNDTMRAIQTEAATQGVNLWKPESSGGGGLSGVIQRQITEETGTELAGLMRMIAEDVRSNRDVNLLNADYLFTVSQNTYLTVAELQAVRGAILGIAPGEKVTPVQIIPAEQSALPPQTVNPNLPVANLDDLTVIFRAIKDTEKLSADYNKAAVDHLVMIEAHTYNTVEELKLAVTELKVISRNTQKEYSGALVG